MYKALTLIEGELHQIHPSELKGSISFYRCCSCQKVEADASPKTICCGCAFELAAAAAAAVSLLSHLLSCMVRVALVDILVGDDDAALAVVASV